MHLLIIVLVCFSDLICNHSHTKESDHYIVEIAGVNSSGILQTMKGYSLLMLNYKNEKYDFYNLLSTVNYDVNSLTSLLKSLGYIDAKISSSIDMNNQKPKIFLYVWQGRRYKIHSIVINNSKSNDNKKISNLLKNVEQGVEKFIDSSYASTSQIVEIRNFILEQLHNNGLPFASIQSMQLISDPRIKSINMSILVFTGMFSYFASSNIQGNKTVSQDFIKKKFLWKPGDIISRKKIAETRNALIKSELFKHVDIFFPNANNLSLTSDHIDATIQLEEAKHRAFKSRIYIDSKSLFYVSVKLEHKNIDGAGGRLNLVSKLGKYYGYIQSSFDKEMPIYKMTSRRKILINGGYHKYNSIYKGCCTHIYNKTNLECFFIANINPIKYINTQVMSGFTNINISPSEDIHNPISTLRKKFHIMSLGIKTEISTSETTALRENFAIFQINTDIYKDTKNKNSWGKIILKLMLHTTTLLNNLILHAELQAGTFLTKKNESIPISDKFFLGGKEMGKGYPYESISPFSELNLVAPKGKPEPTGGLSYIAYSFEIWYAHKKNLAFIVGFDSSLCLEKAFFKDFKITKLETRKIYYSYGIGLLYTLGYNMFIRFDIWVPAAPRKTIDAIFQAHVTVSNYIQTNSM